MKISLNSFCDECEKLQRPYVRTHIGWNSQIEMNDDNIYSLTCENGHKRLAVLYVEKFEMLFEMGTMALIDGYHREAVATFASSMERFIEYYIYITSVKHKVSFNDYNETWKQLAKQSERQLGAFLIFKLIEGKKVSLNSKMIEKRNRIIHQGKVPTKEEAIEYGEYVLAFIREILKEMYEDGDEYMRKARYQSFDKLKESHPDIVNIASVMIPTIINLGNTRKPNYDLLNLREIIAEFEKSNFYKEFYQP